KKVKKGVQSCHLLIESARALPQPFHLVLSGKNGVAIRALTQDASSSHFHKWWAKQQGDVELREFLGGQLAQGPVAGVSTAIDMQMRAPLPARQIARSATHPAGEIDLALALDGGLLVGGWTHDPSSLLAGIEHVTEDARILPLKPNFYKFAGKTDEREDG